MGLKLTARIDGLASLHPMGATVFAHFFGIKVAEQENQSR
jgi:hypothetical protein